MRLERKYLVPIDQLGWLRKRISPFVKPDEFARESNDCREYTVRSIYFDTAGRDDYHQKVEGLKTRKKVRLRGYNQPDDDAVLFLEIKRKQAQRVWKNRAPFPQRHCRALFTTGDVDRYVPEVPQRPGARDDARRFFYHIHRRSMRPSALVVYEREPFVGVFEPDLRITLDKNLRSIIQPELGDLFTDSFQKYGTPGDFILEVKYDKVMPSWIKSIIQEIRLWREALSKYVISLDSHGFKRFFDRPDAGLPLPYSLVR